MIENKVADDAKREALYKYVEAYSANVKTEGMIRHFEYILLLEAYQQLKLENAALRKALTVRPSAPEGEGLNDK